MEEVQKCPFTQTAQTDDQTNKAGPQDTNVQKESPVVEKCPFASEQPKTEKCPFSDQKEQIQEEKCPFSAKPEQETQGKCPYSGKTESDCQEKCPAETETKEKCPFSKDSENQPQEAKKESKGGCPFDEDDKEEIQVLDCSVSYLNRNRFFTFLDKLRFEFNQPYQKIAEIAQQYLNVERALIMIDEEKCIEAHPSYKVKFVDEHKKFEEMFIQFADVLGLENESFRKNLLDDFSIYSETFNDLLGLITDKDKVGLVM